MQLKCPWEGACSLNKKCSLNPAKLCSVSILLAFGWQRTFCMSEVENVRNHLRTKLETVKDTKQVPAVFGLRFGLIMFTPSRQLGPLIPSKPLTRCLSFSSVHSPLSGYLEKSSCTMSTSVCSADFLSSSVEGRQSTDGVSRRLG